MPSLLGRIADSSGGPGPGRLGLLLGPALLHPGHHALLQVPRAHPQEVSLYIDRTHERSQTALTTFALALYMLITRFNCLDLLLQEAGEGEDGDDLGAWRQISCCGCELVQ